MSPGARHLDGAFIGAVRVAAHAADDLLGEENPDPLVVIELRVPLERRDGVRTRFAVAPRIENEAEALTEPPVALRPEIGPRLGDREIDVEENGAEGHHSACSREASGLAGDVARQTTNVEAWRGFRKPRTARGPFRRCGTAIFGSCSRARRSRWSAMPPS